MPLWISERYPPSQRAAVDYLRGIIDEGMLKEIAEADYAQDVEEHLEALMPIWKRGALKELDSWFPVEVLELIRWSEPEDSTSKSGSVELRGHKMRAFSCAVLLATPNLEADKETLIQMVDSVFVLGRKAQQATAKFMAWRIDSLEPEEDPPFWALALAAIIQSLEPELPITEEQELANWVEKEEASRRAYLFEFSETYRTTPWLFGLSSNDMRNKRWEALISVMQKTSGERPIGRLLGKYHKP